MDNIMSQNRPLIKEAALFNLGLKKAHLISIHRSSHNYTQKAPIGFRLLFLGVKGENKRSKPTIK